MRTIMRRLIAAKSHRYGTRHLEAGDQYEASRMHSRVLVGARLASYAPDEAAAPPPAQAQPATGIEETSPADQQELADLRHRARSLGVEVDARWGVNRLMREIAQATARAQQQGETRR